MEFDREALLRTFLAEVEEALGLMEEALIVLERSPDDEDALATVFRLAHSLKGNAEMFEFSRVAELAHVLEDLLERLRHHDLAVTSELITLLLQALDALREMVPEAVAGNAQMPPTARALLAALRRIATADEPPAEPSPAAPKPPTAPRPSSPPQPAPIEAPSQHAQTLRVDRAKLDQLLNLTGEIGIARGRLTQMLAQPGVSKKTILEAHQETDPAHKELQELVIELRMVPLGPTFRHYVRTVRDLAESHGKQARLVIEGEEVEVDATIVECLRDPLTHMIRNALDHGLETPAARAAQGKDPCGLLALGAYHDAGTIVIELSDDGAGLDRRRIVERARSLGILTPTAEPTDQEVARLVFEPGFSTAETVTELSGRGVGMDVVRQNIEALRGSVKLTSRAGKGTKITIRLPLTLAIIDGLEVGVAEEAYIIPLDHVFEAAAYDPGQRWSADDRDVFHLRGKNLPCARLRELLNVHGTPPPRESAVVVRCAGGEAALVVDVLRGEKQTVIKPLTKLFQGLPGISGSAILGNGRVAFILDLPALLQPVIEREAATRANRLRGDALHPCEQAPANPASDFRPLLRPSEVHP
ncbi:MAG: chemotaxis protein CheA [bacterium]|nr:chemotaxis protein CheA [bacterium]